MGPPLACRALAYAKWPYFLMAFLDVWFKKEKPYELTKKVKSTLPKRLRFWPHLLVIVFLAKPLFAEWVLENEINPVFWLIVSVLLVTSGVLIWTGFWRFPAPFDRAIFANSLLQEHGTSVYKSPESLLPDKQTLTEEGAQAPIIQDPAFHAG